MFQIISYDLNLRRSSATAVLLLLRETISQVQKLIKDDLNVLKIDKYLVNIKAGSGGSGLSRYNGVGGNGGDIYFVAKPSLAFTDIKKRLKNKMKIRSENGEAATKIMLIGQHAKHQFFDVPVGIEVVDREKNKLIARCSKPFHRYLIARGGEGGYSGIIEGASMNRGKGYKFLKHLEYADIVVMVVDCQGFQLKNELDCPFRNPLESIALLNREVELYNQKLARKPVICVLNKIDALDENEKTNISSLAKSLQSQKWIDMVPEEMRPKIPMRFEHVVQLSARSGKIDEFTNVLKLMRHHLHALKDVQDNPENTKHVKKRFL